MISLLNKHGVIHKLFEEIERIIWKMKSEYGKR